MKNWNTPRALGITFSLMAVLVGGAKGATTITFNDGTHGTNVTTFYSALGVTFLNGEWSNFSAGYTPHPDSTGLRIVGDGGDFQPTAGSPIVLTFASPMVSVSIIANNVNANGARLELYDAEVGGSLVGFDQVVGPSGSTNSNFVLSSSGSGVRRVELFQPLSVETEGVLFDNLQFDAIPEPTSMMLLGLGTIGFSSRRSRRSLSR